MQHQIHIKYLSQLSFSKEMIRNSNQGDYKLQYEAWGAHILCYEQKGKT